MRVPLSWLREHAPVPESESGRDVAARLIAAGLEVETVDVIGSGTVGPLVVGRVEEIEELTEFKKPIRFCRVAVGQGNGRADTPGERGIICGATNFAAGDLVAVALPESTLPGEFRIGSRRTYGHVSDGMICSDSELGLGDESDGIMVLPGDCGQPGDDALTLLGIGEEVLDIAVTPDRGYALSVRGVAREAATAYGVPFGDPGLDLPDLPLPAADADPHPCGTEDPTACDLFTLRTVTGFDPHAPTPLWMRARLVATGVRSISLAVDITNYVMMETGQPLHAFDLDLLRGPVIARGAEPGEKLETLDHVQRTLVRDDLVIADDRGAVGLAGTMGGLTCEITPDSANIALEAAHFDPARVARMSRRHKLSSEASRRFERGVDRMLAPMASARAVALLLRHGGGEYRGMTAVETGTDPISITMPADHPQRVAGLDIDRDTVVTHLRAVGCQVTGTESLTVVPPTWRPDLTDPATLVEEVLRLVGYDKVPSTLPMVPTHVGWSSQRRLGRRVGMALAGSGYVEVPSYPFLGTRELDALQLDADDELRRTVRLANPLHDEQPFLRTTLLPGLIATALRNVSRGFDDLALFEQGLVFTATQVPGGPDLPGGPAGGAVPRPAVSDRPSRDELDRLEVLLPDQPRHLAVLLTGDRSPAGWWGRARSATWADAIAAAKLVGRCVQVPVDVTGGDRAPFHPGRCAVLLSPGGAIGWAGELHPRVIEAAGLPPRTSAMELDLDALIAQAPKVASAPRIATLPLAKEDVALIVPADVPAQQVADALVAGAGPLLESLRLFDVFRGSQVGEGRRSLAFSLRFRADDRTLTADEVAAARNAAVATAAQRHGAVLRGG